MSINSIASQLPEFAKDLKLNIKSLMDEPVLSAGQRAGLLLACAHATGYGPVVEAAEAEVSGTLDDAGKDGARAAAAIMAMNNVYYRFVHLASNKEYGTMPAKLRMNIIGRPGIEKVDFELYSIAVSATNGCGMCIDSHEKVLKQAGVTSEVIQAAARFGAVVQAVARTHQSAAAAGLLAS